MSEMERKELIERIKAMDQEELELVVDCLPIDICLARVQKEIGRLRLFEQTVRNTINDFT